MSNFLLEIGVEEFPAKSIKPTQNQLKTGFEKYLSENNYNFGTIEINSTPRRFAIIIRDIVANDANTEEKVKGPARKIAFDSEGNPTKALQGFMNSKNITLSDITYENLNGEEYIYALIKNEVKPLNEVLSEITPVIIKSISNPRQMRWGGKNLRFLRPIRWIVSLLDDKILNFELEGIKVSNVTKGHRILGKSHIEINTIEEYESKLEENFVIISEEKRRKMIIRGVNRLSKEKGGHYLEDEDLMDELIQINEYPTPFIGEFETSYLELPKEVIVTPMKDHQRYFPVEDDNGNLLPYFISVRNGDEKGMQNVIDGNKKVLIARLEDAKFFFNKDRSRKLEDYVQDLSKLGYHENLGNMLDKTIRLEKLCQTIGEQIECGSDAIQIAKRAARLAKADLITSTVIEFTELQGIMGRIFAQKDGESQLVAQAIEEQYLPKSSGGELPQSTSGTVLSIAEKIDIITGLHSVGVEVTGSQDLYGQRRAVLGILNILLENRISLDLTKIIKDSLYNFVESFGETFDYNQVVSKVSNFIKVRFKNLLVEKGYRYDIVDSVLKSDELNIYLLFEKIDAISKAFKDESFNNTTTKFVRVVNISKKAESNEINSELLNEEDFEIYNKLFELDEIKNCIKDAKFTSAIELLGSFINSVDKYLDDTQIMVEDVQLKNNRLAIIKTVSDVIIKLFDPTEIVREK